MGNARSCKRASKFFGWLQRACKKSRVSNIAIARRAQDKFRKTSYRWFDIDWSEHLPWTFDGVRVDVGECEDAEPFMTATYADMFGLHEDDHRWLRDPMTP